MKWLVRKPIEAMAIINPELCRRVSVQVEIEQSREGPIPHVHVYLDKTRNPKKCAYIRLDKADYSPHHKSASMSKANRQDFMRVMEETDSDEIIRSFTNKESVKLASGYDVAVKTWIRSYPGSEKFFKFDQDGFPIMPDYGRLL